MAGDLSTDAERAERREAREAAKRPQPRHPDPALDGAELVTVRGKRIKVTDEEFALMLDKAGGFKSRVAKQLGVSVSAVCHRIKRSKFLTETCRTIEETVLDLAEASLIKAAQNGEPWAVTFILKCKGRKRGWIERSDLVFSGELDAPPPPFVLTLHDPEWVEEERKRTEAAMADVVEGEVVELTGGGATASQDAFMPPEPVELAAGGGENAVETPQTATGTVVSRPEGAGGVITQPKKKTPQGAVSAPVAGGGEKSKAAEKPEEAPKPPKPEPKPRAPRTPSEAARMRREREARERVANGGGNGQAATRPAPSFRQPNRGARDGGIF